MIFPRSITGWFVVCWSAFLLAAVVVGAFLISLYQQSTTEQLHRAYAAVAHGCDAIAARYQLYVAGTAGTATVDSRQSATATGLTEAVQRALRDLPGVEGGIWQLDRGSLAYAFPTYEGTGEKTDVPQAEEPSIRQAAETAVGNGAPVDRRKDSRSQVLLLRACPMPGAVPHLAAWTMARVVTTGGRAYVQAIAGLGVLLVVVLGSAAWLGRLLFGWSWRLRRLEAALGSGSDELPRLERTGQRDLDRIVDAINRAGSRLTEARRRADALARRVTQAERLASLGRVSAGVAHEIRNPIAAMRLKAENAIAAGADVVRKDRALQTILDQVGRLEALLRNLLSSVQRAAPASAAVSDLGAFLESRAELFREEAAAKELALEVRNGSDGGAVFDSTRVGQAVDNLILNALQNTPAGGRITLRAERRGDRLVLSVADTGHGVPPAIREHLFEPFVTGRAEGTGLGLAFVREVAEAHGGAARVIHRPDGTIFVVELPWQQC
jgi:signal transduction histidine kinase